MSKRIHIQFTSNDFVDSCPWMINNVIKGVDRIDADGDWVTIVLKNGGRIKVNKDHVHNFSALP